MRCALIAGLLLASCNNPTGQNALPDAKTPKETTQSFIQALRSNHCDVALSFTSGGLKEAYKKMIEAKGSQSACESWREPYLPYDKIEYTFDEPFNQTQKKVWFRLEKDTGEFLPVFVIVEEKNGRWWVVGV